MTTAALFFQPSSSSGVYDPNKLEQYFPANLPFGNLVFVDETQSGSKTIASIAAALNLPSNAIIYKSSVNATNDYCGTSANQCVGAVVFTSVPSTVTANATWAYTVMVDTYMNAQFRTWTSPSPYHWLIDSAIISLLPTNAAVASSRQISVREVESSVPRLPTLLTFRNYFSIVLFVMCFGPASQLLLFGTITEKQDRLKESLWMMGVTFGEYTLSWYLTAAFESAPVWIIVAIITRFMILTTGSIVSLIVLFLVTGLATLSLTFICEVFFSNARTGPSLGLLLLIVVTAGSGALISAMNLGSGALWTLVALFSPAAYWVGITGLIQVELPPSAMTDKTGGITLATACCILLLQSFVYLCIAWYLSQVIPQPFGSPKSPFFLFDYSWYFNQELVKSVYTPSYWNQANCLWNSLISMLTGILPPTSGDAVVGSSSIFSANTRKRGDLGVCPQQDTIFPTLTVRETLVLYARIKNVPANKVVDEVNEIMNSIGLAEKANALSGSLSGGQKRRLSVGIAFIGGSRIVILDEMTSGVDPVSRRELWKIVQQYKSKCTILLTTHFLDEAEALSDRIAILDKGEMKCVGSSLFLKKEFGVGYTLVVVVPGIATGHLDAVKNTVTKFVPDAEVLSVAGGEIQFRLSPRHSSNFGNLIRQLEKSKDVIQSFDLTVTTLDEVFLRLSMGNTLRRSNTATIAPLNRNPSPTSWISDHSRAALNSAVPVAPRMPVIRPSFVAQTAIIIKKVMLTTFRERALFATRVVFPIICAVICVILPRIDQPYGCIYFQPDPATPSALHLRDSPLFVFPAEEVGSVNQLLGGVTNAVGLSSAATETAIISNASIFAIPPILHKTSDSVWEVSVASVGDNQDVTSALANIATNLYLQKRSPGTVLHSQTGIFDAMDNVVWLLQFIGLAIPGLLASNGLVRERTSNAKYQQFISGVRPLAYWTAQFSVDGWIVLLTSLISTSLSHLPSSPMVLAYFGAVGFFIYMTTITLLLLMANMNVQSTIVTTISLVFGILNPCSALFHAMFAYSNSINLRCSADFTSLLPMSETVGKSVGIMFGQAIVYFFFAVLMDVRSFGKKSKASGSGGLLSSRNIDEDVVQEDIVASNEKIVKDSGSLVLKRLNKQYGDLVAVKELSFIVPKGTCFALLGSNGCGKTSTFNMLCGKFAPTSGQAFVNGWGIAENMTKVHESLGVCPQFDALQEYLTVREVITYYGQVKGVSRADLSAVVNELLQRLDLTEHAGKLVGHLSGGNKRKTSVAIALIGNPPVILLDEPSTGMDILSKRRMWDVITGLLENHAVVITTHSMEEAEAISNRLAIMSRGQLKCIGSMDHLRAKFATGVSIDMQLADEDQDLAVFDFQIKEVKRGHDSHVTIHIQENVELATLFDKCEALKRQGRIREYRISPASLEQIFLDVINDAERDYKYPHNTQDSTTLAEVVIA
ncbi:hypothetical protein BDR26DRAFT_871960 [Obelidium mucronatum]|nr:hypothetical protein BDR26DRAFT_871960 [Obelidium mucronatum]